MALWEFFPELARAFDESRRHPQIPRWELDRGVRVNSDLGAAVRGAGIVVVALPSAHVRKTVRGLSRLWETGGPAPWVVNASKGVEPDTLKTMSELIEEEAPRLAGRVYALSGPSFAREVARGVATKVMLAGPSLDVAKKLQRVFSGGPLRVEVTTDRRGVELGGMLKNVLAIACGMLDGMKAGRAAVGAATRESKTVLAGFNTKAALLTEGMDEMGRLIRAAGGRADTVYGLAGLGDLILTGTSSESRNRTLGEKLGGGKTLEAAMREIPTVTEGVESAKSAYQLIRARRVEAPVLTAVWRVLHRGAPSEQILKALGFS